MISFLRSLGSQEVHKAFVCQDVQHACCDPFDIHISKARHALGGSCIHVDGNTSRLELADQISAEAGQDQSCSIAHPRKPLKLRGQIFLPSEVSKDLITFADLSRSQGSLEPRHDLCGQGSPALICQLLQPELQFPRHTEIYLRISSCHLSSLPITVLEKIKHRATVSPCFIQKGGANGTNGSAGECAHAPGSQTMASNPGGQEWPQLHYRSHHCLGGAPSMQHS
jgi:hypothetical protein